LRKDENVIAGRDAHLAAIGEVEGERDERICGEKLADVGTHKTSSA